MIVETFIYYMPTIIGGILLLFTLFLISIRLGGISWIFGEQK